MDCFFLKCRLLIVFCFFCFVTSFAENLSVAVSLQPYANIVKSIGGNRIDVITLLPEGSDPHSYEPKPAILKEFANAKIYFSDGSGIDKAWIPRFKGVNKDIQIVDFSKEITWIAEEEHETHSHHHETKQYDPHVWTSPKRVLIIAKNICEELVRIDNSGKSVYESNLEKLLQQVKSLDEDLKKIIAKLPKDKRTFIVFHPSYGYFALDYGMNQLAIEVDGKEPKPKDLAQLIAAGKKHFVHIVFVQPQFSKRAAATIAKELDAIVVTTDPLAYDYAENTRSLINAISESAKMIK